MLQLRYLGYDIYKNFLRFIFTCIQFIAVLFLFTFVINLANEANMVENEMSTLIDKMNIYILKDITEDYHFKELVSGNEYYDKMLELDKFIKGNSDIQQYTVNCSLSAYLDNDSDIPKESILLERNGYYEISQLSVTGNFFEIFDLQGDFDRDLIKCLFEEYESDDEIIPLILGSNFKGYYQVGDVINDVDNKTYKVKGFLDNGQYYIDPHRELKIFYLDSVFVIPSNFNLNESLDYTFNFLASYFISNDKSNIEDIVKKSNALNLYNLKIKSFEKQLQIISGDKIEAILFNMTIGILILIMSIIGLFGNITQFIYDNMYEFSVHLICGARKLSIFIRIALQVILIIIISNVVNLYIFHFNKASLLTLCGSVILGGLILIYPLISIYSRNIIALIRRYSN